MQNIIQEFDRAYEIAMKKEDYDQAFTICDQLIAANPSLSHGLRRRAAIHARMSNYEQAIEDMNSAIAIDSNEPDYYFFRGWWQLILGNFRETVKDQTTAIEIGRERKFHSYDESAFFFRASAFLYLGKFADALSDCEKVRDDFLIYLTGLGKLTKADIVKKATAGTRQSKT